MNRVLETFETLRKRASMGTRQTQRRITCLCFAISVALCTSLVRAEEAPTEVTASARGRPIERRKRNASR